MYEIGFRAHDLGKFDDVETFNEALLKNNCPKNIQLAPTKLFKNIEQISYQDEKWALKTSEDLKKYNIKVSILGCYVNPLLIDIDKRNLMLNNFKRSIEISKLFNNTIVGTETGTDKNAKDLNLTEEKRVNQFWNFLESVLTVAIKNNSDIAIEPVAGHTINNFEIIDQMLNRFNCDNLKLIYDPVNFIPTINNIKNEDYLKKETQIKLFDTFFKKYHKKICAIHMKDFLIIDNVKKGDLSLFEGILFAEDFLKEMNKYKIKYPLLLENVNINEINNIIANLNKI
ncbi:MAG: sugar phosphate isomerase/epimerase family protein [Pleomorphochaeta sp.]